MVRKTQLTGCLLEKLLKKWLYKFTGGPSVYLWYDKTAEFPAVITKGTHIVHTVFALWICIVCSISCCRGLVWNLKLHVAVLVLDVIDLQACLCRQQLRPPWLDFAKICEMFVLFSSLRLRHLNKHISVTTELQTEAFLLTTSEGAHIPPLRHSLPRCTLLLFVSCVHPQNAARVSSF